MKFLKIYVINRPYLRGSVRKSNTVVQQRVGAEFREIFSEKIILYVLYLIINWS